MAPEIAKGDPGWAGRTVHFRSYDSDGNATLVATVTLHDDGKVSCDRADMLDEWTRDGVVGRYDKGKLFPQDGQRFMDELPFMYKGVYLRAEIM